MSSDKIDKRLQKVEHHDQKLDNHESRITRNERYRLQVQGALKFAAFTLGSGAGVAMLLLMLGVI